MKCLVWNDSQYYVVTIIIVASERVTALTVHIYTHAVESKINLFLKKTELSK